MDANEVGGVGILDPSYGVIFADLRLHITVSLEFRLDVRLFHTLTSSTEKNISILGWEYYLESSGHGHKAKGDGTAHRKVAMAME